MRKYIKDSKKKSISEVLTNMIISYPIHFFSNYLILPYYAPDMYAAVGDFWAFSIINLQLGLWFTIVSFVRQYAFRRLYNHYGPDETTISLLKRMMCRIQGK